MRQAGEPSVEEILESIKKVIARDNRADAAQLRAQREGPGVMTSRGDTSEPRPSDVLELTEEEFDAVTEASDHSDDHDGEGKGRQGEPLIHEQAVASMRDSLAALAMLSQPGAAPQIVRSGETSLEGLVRDMLRPMLSEWLDRNLPAMVEKMVAAEIARIAGKKG